MSEPSASEITALLEAWHAGDAGARDALIPLVYRELHALAHHYMAGEQSGATLQTTALVNELYVRSSTCGESAGRVALISSPSAPN